MNSLFFSSLNADEVVAFYTLLNFLKRLDITGHLDVHTVQNMQPINVLGVYDVIEPVAQDLSLVKDSYDPDKSKNRIESLLESIYGRLSINHIRSR